MSAESSLLMSAVEGKQIAKGQKVTALVPRVEKQVGMARMGGCMQIVATLRVPFSSEMRRIDELYFPGVLISDGGSAILAKRSTAHPRNDHWG
jgi:hypothetical protein